MQAERIKKICGLITKAALTAAFACIVFSRTDIPALAQALSGYPPVHFLAAFFIHLLCLAAGAGSLHAVYPKENFRAVFSVSLKSAFYAMFLPGQILGETAKVFLLSSDQASLGERASAVAIDKVLHMAAMAAAGFLGAWFSPDLKGGMPGIYLFGASVLMFFLLCVIRNERMLDRAWHWIMRFLRSERLVKKGQACLDAWKAYAGCGRRLLRSAFWSIAYHLLIGCMNDVLGSGLGISISYWDYCWMNALLTVMLLLPVSIGGLGIREATLAGLMGMLGVEPEQAVAFSLLLLLFQIIRALLGGILVLAGKGSGKKQGRKGSCL